MNHITTNITEIKMIAREYYEDMVTDNPWNGQIARIQTTKTNLRNRKCEYKSNEYSTKYHDWGGFILEKSCWFNKNFNQCNYTISI